VQDQGWYIFQAGRASRTKIILTQTLASAFSKNHGLSANVELFGNVSHLIVSSRGNLDEETTRMHEACSRCVTDGIDDLEKLFFFKQKN
jgi:hypothetical protein